MQNENIIKNFLQKTEQCEFTWAYLCYIIHWYIYIIKHYKISRWTSDSPRKFYNWGELVFTCCVQWMGIDNMKRRLVT